MLLIIVCLVISIFFIYLLLPTMAARLFCLGAIRKIPLEGKVLLTFDDGPDPRYTPEVLKILKKAGVKACFFVLSKKAEKYPEIIKEIVGQGHEIGSHGIRHMPSWFMGPRATLKEIKESSDIIKKISDSPLIGYRPPWGLVNLTSLIYLLKKNRKAFLWTFMCWDWAPKTTSKSMIEKVKKKIDSGSILVFHDSDTEFGAAPGSAKKMIAALPAIIEALKNQGYQPVLSKDITKTNPVHKGFLMRAWRLWDTLFRAVLKIRDIKDQDGKPTIFRISAGRYLGPKITLPWGETLEIGSKVCDIHINNDYLAQLLGDKTNPGEIAAVIIRELHRTLPVLAQAIHLDSKLKETGILLGITALHRGMASIGFTAVELPESFFKKAVSKYQKTLLSIYHPLGKERLTGKGDLETKVVVMKKGDFLAKYLCKY